MRLRGWIDETRWLLREASAPADFLRLMQARLSLSKLGPLAAPKPRTVRVNTRGMGPVLLRTHTTDIAVFCEMANRTYQHLPDIPARVVIDLGANTGIAARWLHTRYPGAHLVCVEPEPGNAQLLRGNTEDMSATVIEACVGGHERTVGLTTDTGEFGYHMNGAGTIRVLTMRNILEQTGLTDRQLDVVKCDIEGAEEELMETCADWLPHVRALVVECHRPYTADKLLAHVARNGGRFQPLHIERDPGYGVETVTLYAASYL